VQVDLRDYLRPMNLRRFGLVRRFVRFGSVFLVETVPIDQSGVFSYAGSVFAGSVWQAVSADTKAVRFCCRHNVLLIGDGSDRENPAIRVRYTIEHLVREWCMVSINVNI
jgi:hypothetical protein